MRFRRLPIFFACLALACLPGYAGPTGHPKPDIRPQPVLNPNSPQMQAVRQAQRQEVLDRLAGKVTSLTTSSPDWESRYSLYVGCTNTAPSKTYPDIQSAVDAAQLHTTIYVCPGSYPANVVVNKSYIAIVGTSPEEGAESISCGPTLNPSDNSYGAILGGSYDRVKHLTVTNCLGGVAGYSQGVSRYNVVSDSFFNSDYYGYYYYYCTGCITRGNRFTNDYYPFFSQFSSLSTIQANQITGDGSGVDYGMVLEGDNGDEISGNTVTGSYTGLEFTATTQFSTASGNHFNENEYGLLFGGTYNDFHLFYGNNSGNTIRNNCADNNTYYGFYVDDNAEGVNASPDSGPNRFISNSAFGNGTYDYFDATTSTASGTNDGTANYYRRNKGKTAMPPAILEY